DGVNQSNINGDKLSNYPFPYCSLEEQRQIASILDERLTEIDRLDSELEVQEMKAKVLKSSVLKKAFSGRIAEADPSDEPAAELLERIRNDHNNESTIEGKRRAA